MLFKEKMIIIDWLQILEIQMKIYLFFDIKEYLEILMTETKTQRPAEDISKIRLGTPYAWTDEKEFHF